MKVRFSRTAAVELDRTLSYVRERDPRAADRISRAIERTLDWIARWPEASPEIPGLDIRSTLVPRYQYRVFYRIVGDEIIVRNIRGTRQQRPWEPS